MSSSLENSPAARIIKRFGGLTKAAAALGKAKSTVQRWKDSGYIRPHYYSEILDVAHQRQIKLDPNDFNLVDVTHPAFNAPCTPSPDSTSGRIDAASLDPIPETSQSRASAPQQNVEGGQ